jgi:hypothetical protein
LYFIDMLSCCSEQKAHIIRTVVAELHDKNAELLQQLDSMGLSHGVPGVLTLFIWRQYVSMASFSYARAAGDSGGLPQEVRRARATLDDIGGSEGLLKSIAALKRVADSVWMRRGR